MNKIIKLLTIMVFTIIFVSSAHAKRYNVKTEDNIFPGVYIIGLDKIEPLIEEEILSQKQISSEKVKVEIKSHPKGIRMLNPSKNYSFVLRDINLKNGSGDFEMDVTFLSDDLKQEKVTLSGSYNQIVSIPVLNSQLPRNTVIDSSHISWIEIEKEKLHFDSIMDETDLIGKAVKRTAPRMRPLRHRNIINPILISRNSNVEIVYKTEFMHLRTLGVALDEGSLGEVIRVRNASSNKIINVIVQNSNQVIASGSSGFMKLSEAIYDK
ncbi:flagellar basal body P-ring formation chaperone FlgA [Rickettsiales bacterium]|nr:flagellar basal body P-ring formation chaperone FlgA [Rickettsiales bacterium]